MIWSIVMLQHECNCSRVSAKACPIPWRQSKLDGLGLGPITFLTHAAPGENSKNGKLHIVPQRNTPGSYKTIKRRCVPFTSTRLGLPRGEIHGAFLLHLDAVLDCHCADQID